jgi:beta-ketoacyl synthase-like protein
MAAAPDGAAPGGVEAGGVEAGGTEAGGTEAGGTEAGGTEAGGTGAARGGELTVLARGSWPIGPDDVLPALPGFVVSTFSPLAAAAAYRCLERFFGSPPAPADLGERTGVVLASASGDIATAVAVAAAVDEARRVPPMLFYQSNPNAIVGYITARWGLAGPVVCTCPSGDVMVDARDSAALLVADGDADAVLVIAVSQAREPGTDHAEAELLGPPAWQRATTGNPPG